MLSIKRYLPRTLFGRSLMILVTPVVLIQLITTFVFVDRHWSKMTTRLAYAVSGEVAVVASALKDGADNDRLYNIVEYAGQYLSLTVSYDEGARLPSEQEASITKVWEEVVADRFSKELAAQIAEKFVVRTDFVEKMMEVSIAMDGGVLTVNFPLRRLYSSSGYIFLLWMVGTSLLLLIIAIAFMRNQVRPIRKLAAAATRFGKGRDTPYFKEEGAREVRQAGRAFLDMRRRIERQISQRTDMLAGVSHDLRTPLTRMKLQVEMLPDSADKQGMREDIEDMERMIHGYLDFVRGDGDEDFQAIQLSAVFEKLGAALKRQNTQVEISIDPDLSLPVRPLAFERAMNNLLTNASKYADRVWVKAFGDGEKIQIQVEDDGPGVPEDQYEEVFKPFTRVDSSRNPETGGIGLGLPIAMDIVHSHGGKIWLEKSEYGGLCAIVRMPV